MRDSHTTSFRRPLVLCLDDDPGTLGSLKRLLHKEPYEVVTTGSPSEALDHFGRSTVDVVIADERMPDISGTAFLRIIEECSPKTTRVIVSGHPLEEEEAGEPVLVHHFIPKPWKDDEVRTLLRDVLQSRLPAAPPLSEGDTARRPAGPEFMAEQPVLVECTQRTGAQVMTKLLP